MSYKESTGIADGLKDAIIAEHRDFINYDPVGLPDETDVKNIKTIIRNHDRVHPGEIAAYVAQARKDREAELNPWHKGYVNVDNSRRRVLTMPGSLLRQIEDAYPLMFLNRDHLAWFKKNFPLFNSSTRN